MAQPTLLVIRTDAAFYANDTNFSIPASNYNRAINSYGQWMLNLLDQRFTHDNETTTGLIVAAGGYSMITTPVNYARIVKLFRESAAGTTSGLEMEYESPELFEMNRAHSDGAEPATKWTAFRQQTTTAASVGKWRVLIRGDADATYYFSALVEKTWTDLSADGDTPDISPFEGDWLSRLVASDMLNVMGNKAVDQNILLRPLPEKLKLALKLQREVR